MFCKKLPNCLPKWLYHFAVPPTMNDSTCCSTTSPAFGVMSVLDFGHSNRSVVVSHCFFNSLMAHDMEHLFIWLFSMCISSLLKCLYFFCPFWNWVFIFLLLSFKTSLFILDNNSLLNTYLQVVSPSLCLVFSFSWPLHFLIMWSSISPSIYDYDI